jgi:thiol:disulfide interchange protein DsbD
MKIIQSIIIILLSNISYAEGLFDNYEYKQEKFLSADNAFKFSYELTENKVVVQWIIAEDYYMYKEKIKVTSNKNQVIYNNSNMSVLKYDEGFEKTMEVYYEIVEISFDKNKHGEIIIESQGCANEGLCYPLQKEKIILMDKK